MFYEHHRVVSEGILSLCVKCVWRTHCSCEMPVNVALHNKRIGPVYSPLPTSYLIGHYYIMKIQFGKYMHYVVCRFKLASCDLQVNWDNFGTWMLNLDWISSNQPWRGSIWLVHISLGFSETSDIHKLLPVDLWKDRRRLSGTHISYQNLSFFRDWEAFVW